MITAIFILTMVYVVLLIWFSYGWQKIPEYKSLNATEFKGGFSVIVPFRNEEENMQQTLEQLAGQTTEIPFEVIFVDDHSEDQTPETVRRFIDSHKQHHFIIHTLEKGLFGKKEALLQGASQAKYNWLVFTDADCSRGANWLQSLAAFLTRKPSTLFVSMPVGLYHENNLFEKIQSLEFLSLNGIGASTLMNGYPTMCNGANLAVKKEIFISADAYKNRSHVASGDDEFLLHEVWNNHPWKAHYLKSKESIVSAKAKKSLFKLIMQRKRWVSKSKYYNNPPETFMQLVVFLFHAMILGLLVSGFRNPWYFELAAIIFFLKIMFEIIFINPVAKFFGKNKLVYFHPIAGFFYIFYVVIIAFYGNIGGYSWKGRKVK